MIAAVQRILNGPDSGIHTARINSITIFKADSSGNQVPGTSNIWEYLGPGMGPEVDPGPGVANDRLPQHADAMAGVRSSQRRAEPGLGRRQGQL